MAKSDPTVDPRIAATRGRRRVFGDSKKNYEWPGMVDARTWERSDAHRHTSHYGGAFCGTQFKSPHAVYTHVDKRHPGRTSLHRGIGSGADQGDSKTATPEGAAA